MPGCWLIVGTDVLMMNSTALSGSRKPHLVAEFVFCEEAAAGENLRALEELDRKNAHANQKFGSDTVAANPAIAGLLRKNTAIAFEQ